MITYKDFPKFYENEFIKAIAANQKWTISDKDKMPIDMHALMTENKIWGMAFDRGYNPLVTLDELNNFIPNAANNAYYLDALIDKFVILDIEPKCPDNLKTALLQLPYIYGEISMSGKGYHLAFKLPEGILDNYPNAKNKLALKHEKGYFEILLNHMVTFTRNTLPDSENGYTNNDFINIFELLASKATENTKSSDIKIIIENINEETENIPYFDAIMNTLRHQTYKKTTADFYEDLSRYEYGICGFYYRQLMKLLPNNKYKDHEYDEKELALILYAITTEKVPYRPKHDEKRNGMPLLLHNATNVINADRIDKKEDQ